MELNLDCVRDILLTVEKNPFGKRMNLSSLNAELPKYSQEQLWYTCIKQRKLLEKLVIIP